MKNLLCFCFLAAALCVNSFAAGSSLINLGLISQLVEIKYNSEACFSKITTDPASPKLRKDSALANYNEIRVRVDRIIYQISADMRWNNSVKTYKRLNKYYKIHALGELGTGVIEPYILAIQDLDFIYRKYLNAVQLGGTKGIITTAAVLSVLDTGWTITKNIKDMQGKKVDGIIELLNNLRLNAPAELVKLK